MLTVLVLMLVCFLHVLRTDTRKENTVDDDESYHHIPHPVWTQCENQKVWQSSEIKKTKFVNFCSKS